MRPQVWRTSLDTFSMLGKLCGKRGIMVMKNDVIEYAYLKSCQ